MAVSLTSLSKLHTTSLTSNPFCLKIPISGYTDWTNYFMRLLFAQRSLNNAMLQPATDEALVPRNL